MSHACVIVALSPEDIARAGGVDEAVAEQMEPFSEENGGGWFADGSRWNWFQIGGRFQGTLGPGYDPSANEANWETCFLCTGTGKRMDALGIQARRDDPAYTCNGCSGTGWCLKHASGWEEHSADIRKRGELDEAELIAGQRRKAETRWAAWEAEKRKDDFVREHIYCVKEGETREQFIDRNSQWPLIAYAFLRERRWCERSRMGWFAASASTECELKAAETGDVHEGKCLHTCEKTGAKIVSYAEDEQHRERWDQLFWPRFIRNLPPETVLVVVDYHV